MSHRHEPSTQEDEYLADRYGQGPARGRLGRGARVAIAIALAAATAVAAWFAIEQTTSRPVTFTDVGFTIVSAEQVDVTFDVSMPPGTRASCTITALNPAYAQVGSLTVDVGPIEQRTARYTAEVRTTERATTGIVDDCVPVGS